MEEIISQTELTLSLFREGYFAVYDRKKQLALLYCGLAFAAFGAAFLAIQQFTGNVALLGGPVVCMGLFLAVWSLLLPGTECRRKFRAMGGKRNRTVQRTVIFRESWVEVSGQGRMLAELRYDELRDWVETEHLLILRRRDRMGVLARTDVLTDQEREQVRLWLAHFVASR